MRRVIKMAALAGLLAAMVGSAWGGDTDGRAEILGAREAVWRAWFADDQTALRELVPRDTIVISAGDSKWKNQADVFEQAEKFHANGGRLIELEFPRTEMQRFGEVAVTYSEYRLEIEEAGKRSKSAGRVTEIFVRRDGKWVNPGWHTDEEK